jgi:hypothetical protein
MQHELRSFGNSDGSGLWRSTTVAG